MRKQPAAISRGLPSECLPAWRARFRRLLTDVPDPDAALNLFERLTETAPPELFVAFDRDRALVHYALAVFGYSHFLGETLIQNTDLFHMLHRDKMLDRSRSRDEYREAFARFRSRSFETDIALLLARFKRREYVRIMLRDVLGIGHAGGNHQRNFGPRRCADRRGGARDSTPPSAAVTVRRSTSTPKAGSPMFRWRCFRWASWAATS